MGSDPFMALLGLRMALIAYPVVALSRVGAFRRSPALPVCAVVSVGAAATNVYVDEDKATSSLLHAHGCAFVCLCIGTT